jgi:hypothetical protein
MKKLHTDVNYLFEIFLVVVRSNLTLFYQKSTFLNTTTFEVDTLAVLLTERASSENGGKVRLCTVVCLFYLKSFPTEYLFFLILKLQTFER